MKEWQMANGFVFGIFPHLYQPEAVFSINRLVKHVKPSPKTGWTAWQMMYTMSASDGDGQWSEHAEASPLECEQVHDISICAFMCPNVECDVTARLSKATVLSASDASHFPTWWPNEMILVDHATDASDNATSESTNDSMAVWSPSALSCTRHWLSCLFRTWKGPCDVTTSVVSWGWHGTWSMVHGYKLC